MANKFNRYLGGLASLLGDKGNLGDYQHAARLYVDDTFRLAPRNKFLYYVVFNLNTEVIRDISFNDRHRRELNYLVSSADLPKFTIDTEPLNQYNRKTNSYKKIQYDPVNIKFHDDNNGITNNLWALYYGYFFRDRSNIQGSSDLNGSVRPEAYLRNTYASKGQMPYRYGLDNDSSMPFFNSIQLCTLSRQRFYSYLLCNPKITKWEHDTVDQKGSGEVLQNSMTIAYDAVIYSSGTVRTDSPAGFAQLHYDTVPSPIFLQTTAIRGMNSIFDSVGDFLGIDALTGRNSRFNSLRSGTNIYQNLGNRNPFGAQSPALFGERRPRGIGGLQNYTFGSANNAGITTAVAVGAGIAAVAGNSFTPNRVGTINQQFSSTTLPPGAVSPTANDVFSSSLPGGTAARNFQNSNSAGTLPGTQTGTVLSAARASRNEANSFGGESSNFPTAPANITTASFQPTSPSNTTREILSDSEFLSNTSPFE